MNRKKLLKCVWKSIPKKGPSCPRGIIGVGKELKSRGSMLGVSSMERCVTRHR